MIPVLVSTTSRPRSRSPRRLARGGLTVLEITLRTDAALDAIAAIGKALPDAPWASAPCSTGPAPGGRWTMAAGSRSAPGARRRLLDAAEGRSACRCCRPRPPPARPWLAERGYLRQKLFPAEASGGVALLKSLGEPLPQIRFCPTGGIDVAKAPSYLALKNVVCVGGSWVAPKDAVEAGDWPTVERLAGGGGGASRSGGGAGFMARRAAQAGTGRARPGQGAQTRTEGARRRASPAAARSL